MKKEMEGGALSTDKSAVVGNGAVTKSQLLAELMGKPETYDQIDSAWRLVMWLMLVEDGVVVMSYDEIAERLGSISKSTVKKWADGLVEKRVMERQQKGTRVELKLTGDFMRIAKAPDSARVESTMPGAESPALLSLKKIAEGAEELGGHIVITVQECQLGNGTC